MVLQTVPDPAAAAEPAAAVAAFAGMIGVARRDVTPPVGIFNRMWGAAAGDRATGLHRPLTLTALSLASRDGRERVLLVALDLGAWRRTEDERRLRAAVQEAAGLDEARVVVHLTHTHAGPSICPEDGERPGGELIEPYLDLLRERAADAARCAAADAVEAGLDWALGRCELAADRDLEQGDRFLVGWNPDGRADDAVLVGRVRGRDGRTLATIVNYACHPTVLGWGNAKLSPDYVGAAQALVEAETEGAPCLFLQGAEGDVAPREQYVAETATADRLGRALGHAALAALATMGAPGPLPSAGPETELAVAAGTVALPLAPADRLEELAARFWPDLDERVRAERVRRAQWRRRAAGDGASCDYPIWAWRLGRGALAAHPGEAYNVLQRELRARRPGCPLAVLSLANGPLWTYLPPRERFGRNVYQVWHTPFAAGCHERLLDGLDALLAGLWDGAEAAA